MILGRLLPSGEACKLHHSVVNQIGSGAVIVVAPTPHCPRAGDWQHYSNEIAWQLLRQLPQRHPCSVRSHIGGAGALGPPLNGQLLRVISAVSAGGRQKDEGSNTANNPNGLGRSDQYSDFSARNRGSQQQKASKNDPPLLRVRLSVHYRVHSRQMLCIGGNQIPFGWSFMSIAKVPMLWSEGDIWFAEFDLPANSKMEYKYVIMEEQDWTTQVSEDAEGVVSFSYRTEPGSPPDVHTIQKQMAIVAWQPGPNRVVNLPRLEEWEGLQEGEVRQRELTRVPQQQRVAPPYNPGRLYGRQALGGNATRGQQTAHGAPGTLQQQRDKDSCQQQQKQQQQTGGQPPTAPPPPPQQHQHSRAVHEDDPPEGTWETMQLRDNVPLLERRDVWGLPNPTPRLSPMQGLRFDT